jgi:hypothetical protein
LSSLRELQKFRLSTILNQAFWKGGKDIMPIAVQMLISKDGKIERLSKGQKLTRVVKRFLQTKIKRDRFCASFTTMHFFKDL